MCDMSLAQQVNEAWETRFRTEVTLDALKRMLPAPLLTLCVYLFAYWGFSLSSGNTSIRYILNIVAAIGLYCIYGALVIRARKKLRLTDSRSKYGQNSALIVGYFSISFLNYAFIFWLASDVVVPSSIPTSIGLLIICLTLVMVTVFLPHLLRSRLESQGLIKLFFRAPGNVEAITPKVLSLVSSITIIVYVFLSIILPGNMLISLMELMALTLLPFLLLLFLVVTAEFLLIVWFHVSKAIRSK